MKCQTMDRHFLQRREKSSDVETSVVIAMLKVDGGPLDPTTSHAVITDRKPDAISLVGIRAAIIEAGYHVQL